MARLRNACDGGGAVMDVAEVAMHEIRNTSGVKHLEPQLHSLTEEISEGMERTWAKYTYEYSTTGDMVVLDVELKNPRCKHRFWLTWPDLKLYMYCILSCNCTTTCRG